MSYFKAIAVASLLAANVLLMVDADIYFHNPRGSNNRLFSERAQAQNGNRLFDSQNNAKGGYNVGEATSDRAEEESDFYRMVYFQSGRYGGQDSELHLEWTHQHGCGTDELLCTNVIQMLCEPQDSDVMRDGQSEETSIFTPPPVDGESEGQMEDRRDLDATNSTDMGVQESWDWYNQCYHRKRNPFLYTAERRLQDVEVGGEVYESAIFTRQNNRGNRHGYECPEERDYYPYFHPNPWKDIGILTDDSETRCPQYLKESFSSHNKKGLCAGTDGIRLQQHYKYNNKTACEQGGNEWFQVYNYLEKAPQFQDEVSCIDARDGRARFIWKVPYDAENYLDAECLVALMKPLCLESPVSRSNHHGSVVNGSSNPTFKWTLPYFPSGTVQKCVIRIRYNITSYDFDPETTDWEDNQADPRAVKNLYATRFQEEKEQIRADETLSGAEKRAAITAAKERLTDEANQVIQSNISPIQTNPNIAIASGFPEVRFATNADQMGRVFQDRSHMMLLAPRPAGSEWRKLHNLNVKGKRGNIVQTYPAIEYDFVPNNLQMNAQDLVHVQWTGSNRHIGDGEGKQGTDRSNIVQVDNFGVNYPLTTADSLLSMWTGAQVVWTPFQAEDQLRMHVVQTVLDTIRSIRGSRNEQHLTESDYHRADTEQYLIDRNKGHKLDKVEHVGDLDDVDVGETGDQMPPTNNFYPRTTKRPSFNRFPQRPQRPQRPWRMSNRGKRDVETVMFALDQEVGLNMTAENVALAMLTGGRYWCLNAGHCPDYIPGHYRAPADLNEDTLNDTLDQASASFPGMVMKFGRFDDLSVYNYISSRNNKFSNRMQKGRITVV